MPPPTSDYVELRCRSAFSFLEASSNPEDLVECAARLGYPALALADRAGLYGAPRFHQAAVAAGVRAIVGAEVEIARAEAEPDAARSRLLLLVESPRGYRNLCRLLSEGHARAGKDAASSAGTSSRRTPTVSSRSCAATRALSAARLERARGVFRERLWVDVSRHATRASEVALRRAAALADAARVPLVATNDVRHARPEGRALFDALTCLRHKTSLDRAGRLLALNAERHLRPREEMARRFADHPEWIRASREIAERCAFGLKRPRLPLPRVPDPARRDAGLVPAPARAARRAPPLRRAAARARRAASSSASSR